jgi:hypothetical protein
MVAGSFTCSQSRSIILTKVEDGMKNPAMTPTAKAKKRIDLSPIAIFSVCKAKGAPAPTTCFGGGALVRAPFLKLSR